MKRILLPFCFLFFTKAFAQTQDLISLAQGDFLGMNALFDEHENLFGYISLYDQGKSGEKTKKFEYVILDKNLNPFANNTFEGDITAGDYYGYINFDGSLVLRPTRLDLTHIKKKDAFSPTSRIINLKDNTVTKKVYYDYDHGRFEELEEFDTWKEYRKENRAEKKENGYNYISSVTEIEQGGYLAHEYDDYGSYAMNNHLMRYDEHKNLMWKYEYNKNGSKKESQALYNLETDSNYYYALLWQTIKSTNTFYLLVLDMKTGEEIHKKEIPDPDEILPNMLEFTTYAYGLLDNDKSFDDKIVIAGRTISKSGAPTGYSRLLIDRKSFTAQLSTVSYKDFKPYVPRVNNAGFVEKGYFLDPRDIFFLKDGSIGFLFEKYKAPTQYTVQKTRDLVYIYTNKDFKVTGAQEFEKDKSNYLNTDYLFSQNLNNGDDLVFFYRDYQKDDETRKKNWNLFINTYIDGKFNQEVIPISSKENYVIFPYIAKEGYILLQEYNKEAKYNQVRLERLNY